MENGLPSGRNRPDRGEIFKCGRIAVLSSSNYFTLKILKLLLEAPFAAEEGAVENLVGVHGSVYIDGSGNLA